MTLYFIERHGRIIGPWLHHEVTEHLLPGDTLLAVNAEQIP